ncbi:MAG TPA: EamA family transporter [Mycobacteriales bacterium]|nr:EamA family transporter [Mycobacteriales bacterium]
MTTGLALLASLLWGGSDFLGGTAARRLPAVGVVLVSQAVALAGLVVVAAATGGFDAGSEYVGWAAAAAVVGLVALVGFYAALAEGTMGVVAPIAALGVVVPVLVGVGQGDRPTAWQGIGVAVAVLGVVLASGPELRPAARAAGGRGAGGRRPLLLAALAAVGFGLVVVFVARGAQSNTLMTLLVMRAVTVALLTGLAGTGRIRVRASRRDLPMLAAIGIGDVGANAAFAVASTGGLLSMVAVLSSLYPAVTVLLARAVHDERLQPVQTAGVVGALAGVALIASGGGAGG